MKGPNWRAWPQAQMPTPTSTHTNPIRRQSQLRSESQWESTITAAPQTTAASGIPPTL